jgi:hypothetical protein
MITCRHIYYTSKPVTPQCEANTKLFAHQHSSSIRLNKKAEETLINSAIPVHANNYILYNGIIKNTGAN